MEVGKNSLFSSCSYFSYLENANSRVKYWWKYVLVSGIRIRVEIWTKI